MGSRIMPRRRAHRRLFEGNAPEFEGCRITIRSLKLRSGRAKRWKQVILEGSGWKTGWIAQTGAGEAIVGLATRALKAEREVIRLRREVDGLHAHLRREDPAAGREVPDARLRLGGPQVYQDCSLSSDERKFLQVYMGNQTSPIGGSWRVVGPVRPPSVSCGEGLGA